MAEFTRPATWEDLRTIARYLNDAAARYALVGGYAIAAHDAIFEREGNYAIRINDVFTVDVLPAACGHPWSELSRFIEEVVVDDVPIRVLNLEGLLLTKEGLRDRDRADHAVLRAALDKLRGA